jgi:hypothetical protein
MSNDETPSVEEIKERLKVEIPIEEEATKEKPAVDVAAEFKDLGRQLAETLKSAWNSQERQRFEKELREGVKSFADEVERVIREAKDSPAVEKVKEEAVDVKSRVESSDIGRKTRHGLAQGLQWLSEELEKLATQFTPPEKEAADATASEKAEGSD